MADVIEITEIVHVDNVNAGRVIGPRGDRLRRIREETGVTKVEVHRQPNALGKRAVEIIGTTEKVGKARFLVEQFADTPVELADTYRNPATKRKATDDSPLQKQDLSAMAGMPGMLLYGQSAAMRPLVSAPLAGNCRLIIDEAHVGHIIGKGGRGLKDLREASGAKLDLERTVLMGGRLLSIMPPLDAQERCVTLLCDRLAQNAGKTMVTTQPLLGHGLQIQQMQANLMMAQHQMTPEAFAEAQQQLMIMQLHPQPMAMVPSQETDVVLKFLVPAQHAGRIVGKGGAGLKELRTQHGVKKTELAPDELVVGERILTLHGSASSVSAAVYAVLARIHAQDSGQRYEPRLQQLQPPN